MVFFKTIKFFNGNKATSAICEIIILFPNNPIDLQYQKQMACLSHLSCNYMLEIEKENIEKENLTKASCIIVYNLFI